MHKATASRLIATLAERGLVERDPVTEKYRLGFGLIRLAGAAMAGLDLVRTGHPILEDLAERTRETVNLGVLSGDAVVYVDQISGTRAIVSVSWVGRSTPLHCTSNGKVLLANMPDDASATGSWRVRSSGSRLTRSSTRRRSSPSSARSASAATRRRSRSSEEGLNAVAAPVRGSDGDVVAALSVSGPAFRMRAVDLPRIARLTMDAAGAVSRRLGYVERGRTAAG